MIILHVGWFCALWADAVRRLTWITPCKPQAQLGVEGTLPLSELRSSSTPLELWQREIRRTPSCATLATGLSMSDTFGVSRIKR
jgi:hypothetical protein